MGGESSSSSSSSSSSVAKKRSLGSTTTTGATTDTATNIRLLLHCVDGCVPYLNPSQLEQHFPPSETPDLWLGLAVRDSCVAPVYGEAVPKQPRNPKPSKQKAKTKLKLTQKSEPSPDGTTTTTTTASAPATPTKDGNNRIRGYTFHAAPPDPWLLPYTRFTVPSFDLRKSSSGKTSKNTNNAIHVTTPHGKQKLTPDLYATAALEGLQSHHALSLFDDVDDDEFTPKRKQKAASRNHQWFRHLASKHQSIKSVAASKAAGDEATNNDNDNNDDDDDNNNSSKDSSSSKAPSNTYSSLVWKPVLLPHETETASMDAEEDSGKSAKSSKPFPNNDESTDCTPSGLAFVGCWHPGVRFDALLRNNTNTNTAESIPWKAILTTHSLKEIIEIASTGIINVIGTDLPRKWAKEKLALALDLDLDLNLDLTKTRQSPQGDEPVAVGATAERDDQPDETAVDVDGPQPKRQKTAEDTGAARPKPKLNADGCMDLSDESLARDPKPLVEGCGCFVCKDARFSRAYIHHLVVAKEMVAEILLFGHNLHRLLQLLRAFDSNDPDRGKAVKEIVYGQLPS